MAKFIDRPQEGEYGPYYQKYIDKVTGDPLIVLSNQIDSYTDYIHDNCDRMEYSYGEGKWNIRESLIHIIDTEQIFAYRALRISRGDKTPLAGYDQDDFINNNSFGHISPWDILEEFNHQRRATISMIKKFNESQLKSIESNTIRKF